MTLRLHLGGTRHGQILVTPADDREIRWAVPIDPASFWDRKDHELRSDRLCTESYLPKKLGLFGRTLTVMVERSIIWNDGQTEEWAMEFLISSLARTLMKGDGSR